MVRCKSFCHAGAVEHPLLTPPKTRVFQCAQCHADASDHELRKALEMIFACKKCKKTFRKDMSVYDDSDEYCPHCDNHYVIEAKIPQAMLVAESEDSRVDSRMMRDDRIEEQRQKGLQESLRELEDLMADEGKLDQRQPLQSAQQ